MTSDKQKGKSEPVHACICCKLGEKLSCLTLSDCVEGIFYLLLLACLLLSIATTIRSFIVSGEKVTSFQLKSVNEHVHPCEHVFLHFSENIFMTFQACKKLFKS